jgi:hypothetical protein
MELVGVSHGLTLEEFSRWEALARTIGARHWQVCDTGSPTKDAKRVEVTEVSNSHYEFGGYVAGVQRVQTEGPYLVVNSTVFLTRALGIWKRVLNASNVYKSPIYGDATPSPDPRIPEIPHPYYSSWIFLIRDREALKTFSTALERSLSQVASEPSPAYAAYLERWLNPRNRFYGWHGPKTPQSLQRKKLTIGWEHRLSAELATLGIASFAELSWWHPVAQLADKIKRHWASFAKS